LGTGLLCGLVPAFQSLRIDVFQVLKSETILEAGHRRGFQFKHWLVASQLALCLVLLLGAGLCLKSFAKLLGLDPGFDTKRTIVAPVNLERAGYTPENSAAALTGIMQRVLALPGVSRVTFSSDHPLYGGKPTTNYKPRPGEEYRFNDAEVGPDFFRTVGMPLLQGKELSLPEFGSDQKKALVNESFVRRYWPDQEVLGKHFMGREVIGIVQDSRMFDLTEEPAPLVFEQVANLGGTYTHLLIRTDGKAKAALPSITATLMSLHPRLSSVVPRTMQEIVLNSLGSQRYTLTLITGYACIALALAAVGLYGLMAYMVSLMIREIGIRLSLGAQHQDITTMVLRFGLRVIALGTLLGLPCGAIATRFIRSELYDVHPLHPLVFGIATGLLGIVALIACWLPARRAARTDPMQALRCQ
jgi:predicted permease